LQERRASFTGAPVNRAAVDIDGDGNVDALVDRAARYGGTDRSLSGRA